MNKILHVLPKYEVYTCLLIWICAFLYGSYKVYLGGEHFKENRSFFHQYDFEEGWIPGFRKDVADYEWSVWKPMIRTLLPWMGLHLILSEFIRWAAIEILPICYAMVTNMFLFVHFGPAVVLLIFSKVLLHFAVLRFRSVWLVWAVTVYFVAFIDTQMPSALKRLGLHSHYDVYFVTVSTGWLQLKCASFCLDYLKNKNSKQDIQTFFSMLGYTYYLPLYFLGPFMLFESYEKGVILPFQKWTIERILKFIVNIVRYIWWIIFLDLILHFFYIHNLEYHIAEVSYMGKWFLNGLGILSGVFFTTKYIAVYGLTVTITKGENYEPPTVPRCGFYLYSNTMLWRYFDVGFYQFVRRYIYFPLIGEKKANLPYKFFASAVTFFYVFIWHGLNWSVFLWSLLNWVEVCLEAIMVHVASAENFKRWVVTNITDRNKVRLKALAYSPFSLYIVIINSFFYSPNNVGAFLIGQFVKSDIIFYVSVVIISYASCFAGIVITDWQEKEKSVDQLKEKEE